MLEPVGIASTTPENNHSQESGRLGDCALAGLAYAEARGVIRAPRPDHRRPPVDRLEAKCRRPAKLGG